MSASDESFKDLPNDEQLPLHRAWPDDNPGHSLSSVVETIIRRAETITVQQRLVHERSSKAALDNCPSLNDRTPSGFHWPKDSPPSMVSQSEAEAKLSELVVERFVTDDLLRSSCTPPPSSDNCDHKSHAASAQLTLSESIIRGLKLEKIIKISLGRALAGAECDALLVCKPNRLPSAVLEIKKPPCAQEEWDHLFHSDAARGGDRVAGEVWAEMSGVRLLGSEKVCRMISAFNQCQLVCTGELNDPDGSDNFDAMQKSWEFLKEKNENFEDGEGNDENSSQVAALPGMKPVEFRDEFGAKEEEAKIFADKIVLDPANAPVNDAGPAGQEILSRMILFILKSCTAPVKLLKRESDPLTLVCKKMHCRFSDTNDKNVFSFGTTVLDELNLESFIDFDKTKIIHAIHHLGMGDSGDCCLGVWQTKNMKIGNGSTGKITTAHLCLKKSIYWKALALQCHI